MAAETMKVNLLKNFVRENGRRIYAVNVHHQHAAARSYAVP